MAGHSHWAGIKHKKGRADKERSKIFSKLSREITVAAKLGDKDPDMNPRLRTAIQAAKQSNIKWIINIGTKFQNMSGYEYSPVNLYSSLKEAFENIGKFYAEKYNIIFTTLRISHVGGYGDKRDKIFNLLKNKKKK